ncbi:hypothetical protein RHSIM_Rhsim07G0065800 [Rhododendron simsii]|uniref:Disease resistance RPP13-like protein 1 n=1 Tax=Rhododendron simsii TaxID=118357 RepID=A0A834GM15_RHOSS|nr:hypothetical protein RHSIM_Rhsim07G0065800 [Rhododendron simsii]
MAVAEIFLAAFLQGLVRMLTSQDLLSFARREKIHDLLMKWSRMLGEIDAVLADAEEKQMKTEQRGIKLWLEDLEDLAYDLDDILDEFSTEALRRHVLKESRASTSKVRALVPTCCTCSNPSTLVFDFQMRSKMDEITTRLKDLFDRRMGLGLQNVSAGHPTKPPQRPPTSSLIQEPCLHGRDEDKKAIIDLLLSDQSNKGKVGVVAIVGMGGVGKTTLAQMVYNDNESVNKHFEMKAWVYVSENFDIMEVTKAILESISDTCNFKALDKVQEKELVFLWMAEGLIQKPMGQKQMEDLGCEYFQELLSRSFFQLSSSSEVSLFIMHGLMHELAQFVAKRNSLRMDEELENNKEAKNITKARHLTYTRCHRDGKKKFEAFQKAKNLRSFLPFGLRDVGTNESISYLTSYVPLNMLPKLRRLRVLSLRSYLICELSSSIGDLKHVRFLDLSCALITTLPESIGTLYNLQTLILRDCKNLNKLPGSTSNLINLRHLDVTGADSLREMPPKIGKLTSLQTLSNFIVSQDEETTINELGNLVHLRGTLCISGLENVADALDAKRANLNNKQGLDVLLMKWCNISNNSRNGRVESQVLDMLRPHKKLKELTISGYHGLTFPTWVENPLFSNMISLKFQNCEKCISLPPLGHLPLLKKLYIQGMKAIENVGLEFYGLGCSNPFPTLQILTLEDMPEWKEWSLFGVKKVAQAFVLLSELSIKRCPKLLGKLPSNLPCLRKLEIEECPLLVVAWVPRPTELYEVRNTLHFDSLTSLSLKDVSFPDFCGNPELGDDESVVDARHDHLSLLTSLTVENIQGLTSLPGWLLQGLTGLEQLYIYGCKDLTSLWKNESILHHHLPALQLLVIEGCPQLISLFEEEDEDEDEEGKDEEEEEEELSRGLHSLRSLKELIIRTCQRLISFPKTGLPSMLTTLDIYDCDALQSLPKLNRLEFLGVSECPSLTYLSCSRTGLPPSLEFLYIEKCKNLESVLAKEGMKINCPSLQYVIVWDCDSLKSLPDVMQNTYNGGCLRNLCTLHISNCENVESIPEGWFNATNLTELIIKGCKKLKGLPHHASSSNNNNHQHHLTSLQKLQIDSCAAAGATGLVSYILKEESSSYFTNLTSLYLFKVDTGGNNNSPLEWGLHRLSSLRLLYLHDHGWASFPPKEEEDGMTLWLPPSLISLRIVLFQNLEKLSCKDFRSLPSLEQIAICGCPKLTTITELGQLPSVWELEIWDCPNLASFSAEEKGLTQLLPPSLLKLEIKGDCPLLKRRCEKGKGKYWVLISRIPQVQIDDRFVFDPSSP